MTALEVKRASDHVRWRDRIEEGSDRDVLNAMLLFIEEQDRQLDLFEDGPSQPEPAVHHIHIFI